MALTNKKHITTFTDEELLHKYKESGRAEYFGRLYSQYILLLYGLYYKYLRDENKAYNAVIALFEELLPQINHHEIDPFRTWLYQMACNHCMRMLQDEEKEIRINSDSKYMESEEIIRLLCDEEGDQEQIQALQNCLGRLPDGQRISIIHFFMKEMSYADIADKTGYSLHTVKKNIQNGKRNLKNCLNKLTK